MGRLIDADVLKKDLTRFYDGEVVARKLIDEQPTVDAVPVRHGRWIPCHPLGDGTPEGYMCSVCHIGGWEETNFCPMCGADMRGNDETD